MEDGTDRHAAHHRTPQKAGRPSQHMPGCALAFCKPKSCARHFKRDMENSLGFWIGVEVV
jgi:hypothetical protein